MTCPRVHHHWWVALTLNTKGRGTCVPSPQSHVHIVHVDVLRCRGLVRAVHFYYCM